MMGHKETQWHPRLYCQHQVGLELIRHPLDSLSRSFWLNTAMLGHVVLLLQPLHKSVLSQSLDLLLMAQHTLVV
jgi:hypothetical protein